MKPKIRLKGFCGEWNNLTLSQIATMHARIGWQNLRKDEFLSKGDYYLITGTDFIDGAIDYHTCHYVEEDRYNQDKNIQLKEGSILITKDGTLGKVAYVDNLDKPATLNAGVFNVVCKGNDIDSRFLFQYLKSPRLMDYVNSTATGGTIKHLNQNILVNFPVCFPEIREQRFIGFYFLHLDSLIQSTSKKIESLKQVKTASLQSMFPQEGETTPRVRFKGFDGEWEIIKFSDFAEIHRGLTYTPNNVMETGVRVLRSSNIDEDTFVTSKGDLFVAPNCVNIDYAKEGDILITAANGSPRLVGKHAIIRKTGSFPMVAGGFMYLVTSQESEFLNASMSSNWYYRFLKTGVAGGNGSIGNLSRNDLMEAEFLIPIQKEERNMLADYFTSLDSQIILQTQRLEKLKQIKSACLDNMFV